MNILSGEQGYFSNIYQSCNVAVFEPARYEEAKMHQRWIYAMEEELAMIEKKNQT